MGPRQYPPGPFAESVQMMWEDAVRDPSPIINRVFWTAFVLAIIIMLTGG